MKAMKCDRCKKYYDTNILNSSGKALWFGHIMLLTNDDATRANIDLCPDCRKSFDLWLKEGR